MDVEQIQAEQAKIIRTWKLDAAKFVEECLGINPNNRDENGKPLRISNQQRQALKAISDLANAKDLVDCYKSGVIKTKPDDATFALAKKQGVSIMSGKGCHAVNTPILRYGGKVAMVQDLEVGDKLIGPDGLPRTITSLKRGREQMYRLQYKSGEYHDVNENHILTLMCTGTKVGETCGDLVDVTVKEYLTWPKSKKIRWCMFRTGVKDFGNSPEHPDIYDPYIFGCWLGDGCKSNSRFYNIDDEVIDSIKAFAKKHGAKYKCRIVKEHIITFMDRPDNPFLNYIRENDTYQNKHIPHKLLTDTWENRLELLAGLLDTDGSLCQRNKRTFEITQKSEQLAKDIQFLARSLGLRCNIKEKYVPDYGVYYRMNIGGNTQIIPTRIKRKQAVEGNPKTLTFGFKVVKLSVDDYYGFSLDHPDGRFLGADFTVLHNTGKDALASWTILWFLCTHYMPKILCVAPTQAQLKQVLWSEIAMWHGKKDYHGNNLFQLKESIAVESEKVYMRGVVDNSKEKDGKTWSAFYRTPQRNVDKGQMGKTLSGQHARNMLFVLDEASGIDDIVFEELENTMTLAVNFALLIFNPHKPSGFAYDTHYGNNKDQWVLLHWDGEESDLVSKDLIMNLEDKYGRESDNFRVNVKGLPPVGGDDCFIPYQWVYDAYNRELDVPEDMEVILGIDAARGGTDYTIVTPRQGANVMKASKIVPADFHQQADEVDKIIKSNLYQYKIARLCVDATGLGHGLADILHKRYPGLVSAVKVSSSPRNPDRFRRLRDELWYKMRDRFEMGTIQLAEHRELIEELHCVGASDKTGKIIIDSKDVIKKKLGRSCDFADSLMLTFFVDDSTTAPINSQHDGFDRYGKKRGRRIEFDAPIEVNGYMYM